MPINIADFYDKLSGEEKREFAKAHVLVIGKNQWDSFFSQACSLQNQKDETCHYYLSPATSTPVFGCEQNHALYDQKLHNFAAQVGDNKRGTTDF